MKRKKTIYVAAASPGEASADLRRLGLLQSGDSLRVVVPARQAAEIESLARIPKGALLRYDAISAAWLWARLLLFLGLSGENEIIVFSPPGRSRGLKLLALALRGRVSFSSGQDTCVPFSLGGVLRAAWRQRFAAQGPICLIGAASPGSLQKILAAVRRRYPEAPVHSVLPVSPAPSLSGLDSWEGIHPGPGAYLHLLRRCFGRRRFRRIILPWTSEKSATLRWLSWWLPLWRVEVYNEQLDAFPGRNPVQLLRHWFWIRSFRRTERLHSLPIGVMGSASSFYLEKILPVLRAQRPAVEIHGLLPESLVVPAAGLFDSIEVLRGSFVTQWLVARRFVRRHGEYQCWVIPCTNEPYAAMKLLGFLLPVSRRLVYNEVADGFPARELWTLFGHYRWRVRDHLSYQIVAGAAGSNWIARLGHLVLYAGRLLAGAALLGQARLSSRRVPGRTLQAAKAAPRVDLFLISRHDGGDAASGDFQDAVRTAASALPSASLRVVRVPPGVPSNGSGADLSQAIRSSDAEFVCLLDADCRMSPQDWLNQLLASFDDRTAQVGPQLASPDGETVVRGLLLGTRGGLAWNFDNAVRWHRRPECLEVDALPRLCVVLRRRIFSEAGYWDANSGTMEEWADAEFSSRLRALGWRSVCNRSVTAVHPALRLGLPAASQEVTEEIRR